MTILIVDDNRPMRRMIRQIIAELAQEIRECSDGEEACSLYAALRPDWVLMDIEMPRVDGIAATERIRAEDPDARIVIVTQHDDCGLREAARSAGARDYVLKDNLLDLPRLLGGRRGHD